MRIKINTSDLISENYYINFYKYSAKTIIKDYFEVNELTVDLGKTEGRYFALVQAYFFELPIVIQKFGPNLASISNNVFDDLKEQLNLCRNML